jgi:hypothetical protein
VNFSERTRAMENELKRNTSGNISSEQKTILTDFMGAHPELIKRKFNSEFNPKKKSSGVMGVINHKIKPSKRGIQRIERLA